MKTGTDWIDISVPLHNGMIHWPGDPPVKLERIFDVARGDSHTLSLVSMGSHSGTHIDAPVHFSRQGRGIDESFPIFENFLDSPAPVVSHAWKQFLRNCHWFPS